MGRLFLLLVTVYGVVLTGSHASVSPEAYWKSKLPNTPLPQTIKHTLVQPGAEDVLPPSTMTNLIDTNGRYGALLSYRQASAGSNGNGALLSYRQAGYGALLSYRQASAGSNAYDREDGIPPSKMTNLIDSNNGGYKALLSYRKALAGSNAYSGEDVLPPSTTKSLIDNNGGYKALLSYRKASTKDSLASGDQYGALLSYKRGPPGSSNSYIRLPTSRITQEPDNSNVKDITTNEGNHEFFVEEHLKHGSKLKLVFKKGANNALFLPRGVANKIPFSSNKLQEIYKILSLDPASSEAHVLSERIELCEEPTIKGVEKQCVTSLESMVDFVISQVGNKVEALYTKLEKDLPNIEYTIHEVKKLTKHEHETVVCHKMGYPYAVFFCHGTATINSYMVSLVGDNGAKVEAIASCHKETNEFLENYMINVLKVTPGSTRVCHFPPADEDTIIWVAK